MVARTRSWGSTLRHACVLLLAVETYFFIINAAHLRSGVEKSETTMKSTLARGFNFFKSNADPYTPKRHVTGSIDVKVKVSHYSKKLFLYLM